MSTLGAHCFADSHIYEPIYAQHLQMTAAGSIFAYGQTSSGKTYTMTGITEFAVADIFDYIFQVFMPHCINFF